MAEAFPISGNIDPSTFPFLLADLHRQGATGSLRVEGPSFPKALYFRGGRILFGSSNDPRDQLGSILIENGKINQEQLEDVNTKVGPGNPLAKVLAESGCVNQRELSEAARVKVERILSDVLSYATGSFEFEDGVLPKGAVDLKLSTEKLVLAAVARLADRGFVLRHLESLDVVLAPTALMGERIADLRPESGDLPERFDGQRTLKEAASLTRLDEFEAAKIACALLFLGLLRKSEGSGAAAAGGEELDLGQTARMAFDPGAARAAGASENEPAFFVPEAAATQDEGVGITIPHALAPQFGPSDTPPLGISLTSRLPFAPGSLPHPEPETKPTVEAIRTPEVRTEPGDFSLGEPDHATMPRLAFDESPPTSEAPPRGPSPAAPAPSPAPASRSPDFTKASAPHAPLAFEDEPARETVAPARPSKEDLAALDALLNPSASMRSSSTPTSRSRAERWEPQFRSNPNASVVSRSNRRRGGFPIVSVAATVGLLLAATGGAWYYFNRPAPALLKPVVRATPPAAPTTTLAPPPPTSLRPEPVATAPPPSINPTSAPPPSTVPPAPPTPTPKPTPKATAAAGGVAEARQLLERHDYAAAARGFASSLRSSPDARFSVQLLVACSDETVAKALANVSGPELLILPVNYKGKSCYRLCWGLFDSEGRANSSLGSLPAYFREGGAKPKVAPTASLLP